MKDISFNGSTTKGDSANFRSWQNRVLFSYTAFYMFVYMGRFNHWPAGPIIREDIGFTHIDIGIINACLLWGFAIGGFTHGRIAESYGYRFWLLSGTIASVALNWITSFGNNLWTIAIPWAQWLCERNGLVTWNWYARPMVGQNPSRSGHGPRGSFGRPLDADHVDCYRMDCI